MKQIIDYCYYRMTKFYKDWGDWSPCDKGACGLFACLTLNILTIAVFIVRILELDILDIVVPTGAILGTIVALFYSSEKRYIRLCQKYKDETRVTFKGWCVFIYAVASLCLYLISFLIF